MNLDVVLSELKRANAAIVKPANRLKPDLIPARLLLFIEINRSEGEPILLMHLADTRKSRVCDIFIETFSDTRHIFSQKEALSKSLLESLRKNYPLKGTIRGIGDSGIWIDIGDEAGVQLGDRFRISGNGATLKVVSVKKNTSRVTAESFEDGAKTPLKKGMRVEWVDRVM
jgi:hypothetical protein